MAGKSETHFLVTYRDPKDGQILTLRAGKIHDSTLGLAFVAISDFLFDKTSLIVTPEQEALEKRLADVKTLHLSIHAVLSVAEIGAKHKGLKFKKNKSNLVVFPSSDRPR